MYDYLFVTQTNTVVIKHVMYFKNINLNVCSINWSTITKDVSHVCQMSELNIVYTM